LIEKSPNSTCFHTLEWSQVIKRTNKNVSSIYIVARDNSGGICGGLQLFKHKILPGIYYLDTPYWGNPILMDEGNENIRRMILIRLKELAEKPNNIRVFLGDFSNNCSYLNQLGFKTEIFFSYVLELEISCEWMMNNRFHRLAKRNIKKTQKNNIIIEKITNPTQVDQFFQISKDTELRLNNKILYSLEFYREIFNVMNKKGMVYWHLAKKDDAILAGSLHFLYKDRIHNFLNACYLKYFKYSPNYLLILNSIICGFDNGYKFYDLGGHPESKGVTTFKEAWSATRRNYSLYYKNKFLYNAIKKVYN